MLPPFSPLLLLAWPPVLLPLLLLCCEGTPATARELLVGAAALLADDSDTSKAPGVSSWPVLLMLLLLASGAEVSPLLLTGVTSWDVEHGGKLGSTRHAFIALSPGDSNCTGSQACVLGARHVYYYVEMSVLDWLQLDRFGRRLQLQPG